jgi:hypothetical protein
MSAAKQLLNQMIHELPEEFVQDIIYYVASVQKAKNDKAFRDLEYAGNSSLNFWDNPIDDEVWNNV